jgi:hypothetical protein
MIDTRIMGELTSRADQAGAKLILVGDDRQLASIERGGLFTELRRQHGAAELAEVTRQKDADHKAVAELLARGEFAEAVTTLDKLGSITRNDHQDESRAALVEQWTKDTTATPDKSRFVFAYTNDDVLQLNAEIRAVRKARGELGADHELATQDGKANFAAGDRLIFTATDKQRGIINGAIGTVERIEGQAVTLKLDGPAERHLTFDAAEHDGFRHAYAGTIYKGQGRTFDEVYLYHSAHWRDSATYVALTRHRDDVKLFVSTEVTRDEADLARQMGRHDDRRASVAFATQEEAQQQRRAQLARAAYEVTGHEAGPKPEPVREPPPRPPEPTIFTMRQQEQPAPKSEPPIFTMRQVEKAVEKVGQVATTTAHTATRTADRFVMGAAKMAGSILELMPFVATPAPRLTAKEALRNRELQQQYTAQLDAEMIARGKEIAALRQMARDKETGRTLNIREVENLQPATLQEIRDHGDTHLLTLIQRQLVEEPKRQRERQGRGRER